MKTYRISGLLCICLAGALAAQEPYFPGKWDDWERRSPAQVGMSAERLAEAVRFAEENFNRDGGFNASSEPYGDTIGLVKNPSGMNGVILRHDYIVAEWGETDKVDMTFSVISTLCLIVPLRDTGDRASRGHDTLPILPNASPICSRASVPEPEE